MARIDESLAANASAHPERQQQVVVTLARGAEGQSAALGLAEAEQVAPGVYSALLTGAQIQALGDAAEVEEIVPDFQVGTR
jgi:hypothetical protein